MPISAISNFSEVLDYLGFQRYKTVFKNSDITNDLDDFLARKPDWFRLYINNAEDVNRMLEIQRQLLQKTYLTIRKRKNLSPVEETQFSDNRGEISDEDEIFQNDYLNRTDLPNGHNSNAKRYRNTSNSEMREVNSEGMDERHKKVLLRKLSTLEDFPWENLTALVQDELISDGDYRKIRNAATEDKAMELISCIQTGDQDAFYKFLEILQSASYRRKHIDEGLAAEDIRLFLKMFLKKEVSGKCTLKPDCDWRLTAEHSSIIARSFVSLTQISVESFSPTGKNWNIIDCRIFAQCKSLKTVYIHQKLGKTRAKLRNLSWLPEWLLEVHLIHFVIDDEQLIPFLEKVKKLSTLCIISASSLSRFDYICNYMASTKKASQITLSHVEIKTGKRQTFYNDEHSIFHPSFFEYPYYYGYSTPLCKYNLRYFAFRLRKHSLEYSNSSKCNWKRLCHDTRQMTITFEKSAKALDFVYQNDASTFPYNRIKFSNVGTISSLKLRYPELIEKLKLKHCDCDEKSIETIFNTFHNIFALAIEGNVPILERFPETCLERITALRLEKVGQLPTQPFISKVKNLEIMNSKDVIISIENLVHWRNLESLTASEDAQIYPVMKIESIGNPVKLPLKSLIIRNIDITDDALSTFLKSCLNLEVLHLKGDYKVNVETLKELKNLKKLILRQVKVIDNGNDSSCFRNMKDNLSSIQSLTLYCLSLDCAEKVLFNCCSIENLTLFMENQDELETLCNKTTQNELFGKLKRFELFVNLQTCRRGCPLLLPTFAKFPVLEKLLIRPFFDDDPYKFVLGAIPPTVKHFLVEDAIITGNKNPIYKHLEVLQLNRCEISTEFFDNINNVFPQLRAIRIIRCKFSNNNEEESFHKLKTHGSLGNIIIISTERVFPENHKMFSCVVAEKNKSVKKWICNFENAVSHSVDCRIKNPYNNAVLEEKNIDISFADDSVDSF